MKGFIGFTFLYGENVKVEEVLQPQELLAAIETEHGAPPVPFGWENLRDSRGTWVTVTLVDVGVQFFGYAVDRDGDRIHHLAVFRTTRI